MTAPNQGSATTVNVLALARRHGTRLLGAGLVGAVVCLGGSFAVVPTYTARTVIIPPQQPQSAASLALQSLGALAGVAGASAGIKSSIDQYIALLQSSNVANQLIDKFKLSEVYDERLRSETQRSLESRSRITAGRKDGLITIEVDDKDAKRAADMANAYVDQLRRLTGELALTEAQQRRLFFDHQVQDARKGLVRAEVSLQQSGITEGAIRAEPRAFAERYAKLRAEITVLETRLRGMRQVLAETTPEVQQSMAQLAGLRAELAKLESSNSSAAQGDYIKRYRDFKYQEAVLELFVKQLELARIDEAREGPMIQVIDVATPPDRPSRPRRGMVAATGAVVAAALAALVLLLRARRQAP